MLINSIIFYFQYIYSVDTLLRFEDIIIEPNIFRIIINKNKIILLDENIKINFTEYKRGKAI